MLYRKISIHLHRKQETLTKRLRAMKKFKIRREIKKFNKQGQLVTTENGIIKTLSTETEAKQYMANLSNRAYRSSKFSKVTNGTKQFRAYTQGGVYIYKMS